MRRRVAVTGIAGISSLHRLASVRAKLGSYQNPVVRMPEWADYDA